MPKQPRPPRVPESHPDFSPEELRALRVGFPPAFFTRPHTFNTFTPKKLRLKGWHLVDVRLSSGFKCEICGQRLERVFVIAQHEYPGLIGVGSHCSGFLTQGVMNTREINDAFQDEEMRALVPNMLRRRPPLIEATIRAEQRVMAERERERREAEERARSYPERMSKRRAEFVAPKAWKPAKYGGITRRDEGVQYIVTAASTGAFYAKASRPGQKGFPPLMPGRFFATESECLIALAEFLFPSRVPEVTT